MNARDAIGEAIYTSLYDVEADCAVVSVEGAQCAADAVLAWLGELDPSAPGELVAAHLRADRDAIAHLRRTVKELRREIDGLGGLLDAAESQRAY